MDAYDFREMRAEKQILNAKWRSLNSELCLFICAEMALTVKKLTECHFRIFRQKERRALDYFPTHRRASWVGSGKFFTIPDIEAFLKMHFE
jgi:hypothetical protein